MEKNKKYLIPFFIGVLIIIAIFQFIYFENALDKKINSLEEKIIKTNTENQTLEIIYIDNSSNQIITEKEYSFQCVYGIKENSGEIIGLDYVGFNSLPNLEKIILDGDAYLKTKGGTYHNIYSGLTCNIEEGWVLVDGSSSKIFLTDLEGRTVGQDRSFIENNGIYSLEDSVRIRCCRVMGK